MEIDFVLVPPTPEPVMMQKERDKAHTQLLILGKNKKILIMICSHAGSVVPRICV